MKSVVIFALILVMKVNEGETVTCDKLSACKCKYSDGSGIVDLTSLSEKGSRPRFRDVAGTDSLKYSYNPCLPFDEGGQYGCIQVAVCQIYSFTQISGGSQESAKFAVDAKGHLTLEYSQAYTQTTVDLICDKTASEPVFKAIGDPSSTNEIKLSLTHACNCPGICDDKGIISGGGGDGDKQTDVFIYQENVDSTNSTKQEDEEARNETIDFLNTLKKCMREADKRRRQRNGRKKTAKYVVTWLQD